MDDRLRRLQEALPGLTGDMPQEFFRLAEVFLYDAFELSRESVPEGGEIFRIPYMMNDALEAWLVLRDCRITGEYGSGKSEKKRAEAEEKKSGDMENTGNFLEENGQSAKKVPGDALPEDISSGNALPDESSTVKTTGQLVRREADYGLIVKQKSNTFTLWFSGLSWEMTCYQYHRIGHFWVTGQEQWRRLVYMMGTVYDKYRYLGEEACSPWEMELLPLMEFPPFRHWSPIRESLDDWYDTDPAGARLAGWLARQAGDRRMERKINWYLRFPCRAARRLVERAMQGPGGQKLYEEIRRRIWEASGQYPERDYGREANERIRRQRRQVQRELTARGFSGAYPEYRRGSMRIEAAEEHPFTCMEAKDFSFRIWFLVSEGCGENDGICGGFFRKGKGRVEESLAFLEGSAGE